MNTAIAKAQSDSGIFVLLFATVAAFAILITVFWVGFLGSDDTLYWEGAGGWLAHIPYLGTKHWALRHTLVIPMAIARAVLGDGIPALLLPSLLYSVGVLIVTATLIADTAGSRASAAAMALTVTCPQFILLSSVANIDVVEIFFVLLAFALVRGAMDTETEQSRRPVWRLLLAGVCLGFAVLSRETASFAVATVGLLFLAGYGMRRANYLIIGAGLAAVIGLELLYLWWMSGDIFYRATISLHHDEKIDRWTLQGAGIPLIHPIIDPITMLLFNHNFGLLTWIGVPLSVWLMRHGALPAAARRLAVLAIALALVWTLIAAGAWSLLNLAPRYFLLPALLLSMLSGIALEHLSRNGRARLAWVLGGILISANLVSMWIDNRNYLYGEHVLVDIAYHHPGPIHTDPITLRRACLLLQWKGIADRVTDTPAGPGDQFYLNPARDSTPPGKNWIVIERHGLSPTIGQFVAAHILPPQSLSPSLWNKLGRGHPDVTLYRIP